MIAEFHAKALAEIPGARLVSAYNRTPAKAAAFATAHGCAVAATPEELLADPAVDVVCLCTPSGDHLAPALACIRAGKHVVVEKPLEVTLAKCDELIAAARAAGDQNTHKQCSLNTRKGYADARKKAASWARPPAPPALG